MWTTIYLPWPQPLGSVFLSSPLVVEFFHRCLPTTSKIAEGDCSNAVVLVYKGTQGIPYAARERYMEVSYRLTGEQH